jgi:transcriptional regulator with XRE-family HTH domain
MTHFANNLKFIRELNNLSQQEIANIMGIKQSTYSNYERGNTEPNLDLLFNFSIVLRTSLDMLLGVALDVALIGDKKARDFYKITAERANMGESQVVGKAIAEIAKKATKLGIRDEEFLNIAKEVIRENDKKNNLKNPHSNKKNPPE